MMQADANNKGQSPKDSDLKKMAMQVTAVGTVSLIAGIMLATMPKPDSSWRELSNTFLFFGACAIVTGIAMSSNIKK
jgi:uncharacterized membrane protein